jgi:prepilin-type N-terminal cleavage/methylation domain-containing protein
MGRVSGFTLQELLMTLVVASIAVMIAVPRLETFIHRERVRSALNRLAGDLEFTRMAAVRSGNTAVLHFRGDPRCPGGTASGYVVTLRGGGQLLRQSFAPEEGVPTCFSTRGSDTVAFGSRGMLSPFNNRTFRASSGGYRDSLTVSVMGRVYRRF